MKSISVALAGLAVLASAPGLAYPVFINVSAVRDLEDLPRANVIAFAPGKVSKTWGRIPHQIDELEDDAFLVLRNPQVKTAMREKVSHPPTNDPFHGILKAVHRIVLNEQAFGDCGVDCEAGARKYAQEICPSSGRDKPFLLRIDTEATKKVAFLTTCAANRVPLGQANTHFDLVKKHLTGPNYELRLSEESPFLIKELLTGRDRNLIFQDGGMRGKLKTKLLLSFNINENDLKGWVTSVSQSALSTSLELAVSDKILGFSTGKQVCCDITFYDDAFYFPILIGGTKKLGALRKGSGVTLGFHSKEFPVLDNDQKKDSVLFFPSNAQSLAVTLRSAAAKPVPYPIKILRDPKELQERDLPSSNSGIYLDLEGQKDEQRLEAWFFAGKNEELMREYALNGVRFSWKRL